MLLPEGHRAVNLGLVFALKHGAGKDSPSGTKHELYLKNLSLQLHPLGRVVQPGG